MKKILCLILICIFLTGCSNDVSGKSSEPQEEIPYTHEDVDATITLHRYAEMVCYLSSLAVGNIG